MPKAKVPTSITPAEKQESTSKRVLREIWLFLADILYNAVIIILLVVLIRSFLISPFRVIGSSMADTLESNEFILIDKLSYRIGKVNRGDPVVFLPPVTSKYPNKFEEAVTTDENGVAVLDIKELHANRNVIYCQNAFIKKFWFCRESVNLDDLVYYIPIQEIGGKRVDKSWKNAAKKTITAEEIRNKELVIEDKPNTSYAIRIYSARGSEFFVKRVIGIPGDTVKIENGRVYMKRESDYDFTELKEDYLNEENKLNTNISRKTGQNTFEVPEGHYFVLGDNRNHSNDSRSWYAPITQEFTPFIPFGNVSGKVFVVLWPLNNLRFVPNNFSL